MFASRAAVALAKTLEDEWQQLGLDSLTRICNDGFNVRPDALHAHLDLTAPLGEFHRVGQQVPENLLYPVRVAGDRSGCLIEHRLDSNRLRVGAGLYHF